jgi:hypothetical protein
VPSRVIAAPATAVAFKKSLRFIVERVFSFFIVVTLFGKFGLFIAA